MKIFQRYNPLQVAKYVKILFPKVKDKLDLSVMSGVNRQVMRLQTEMA